MSEANHKVETPRAIVSSLQGTQGAPRAETSA